MNKETVSKPVENKMGTMPVGKLLINMSLPMMISMLVQALYNIIDSIFVSQICENALTAVSLAFPIQTLLVAVSAGTGVGVNAVLSKALGAKNHDMVNKSAMNGIFLSVIGYLLFVIIGFVAVKPFYMSQTNDAEIVSFGISYLSVICFCSFGVFTQFIFERLLQSTGRTFYTMITQSTGAIINIILDPILIFGLLGMPKMGVAGAALATITGQTIAGISAILINLKKNTDIQFRFSTFRPDFTIIKQIYLVGLPSIIMQSIGSIMVYGINKILISFSSTATAVFGVYFKLQSFVFMPIFGLNNGMVPIIAYNYGAQNRKRMLRTILLSMCSAEAIMLIGFIIFQTFPEQLFSLFHASEYMLSMGVPALRIIATHFLIAGICIVAGSSFQALGNGIYSMIVSIARQLVVLLPAAYLLSKLGNVNYVWWAFPIAEIASGLISAFFFFRMYKSVISKIPD